MKKGVLLSDKAHDLGDSKVSHLVLKSGSITVSKVLRMHENHWKGMLKHSFLGLNIGGSDLRSLE